jgi:hypothetical protein
MDMDGLPTGRVERAQDLFDPSCAQACRPDQAIRQRFPVIYRGNIDFPLWSLRRPGSEAALSSGKAAFFG